MNDRRILVWSLMGDETFLLLMLLHSSELQIQTIPIFSEKLSGIREIKLGSLVVAVKGLRNMCD